TAPGAPDDRGPPRPAHTEESLELLLRVSHAAAPASRGALRGVRLLPDRGRHRGSRRRAGRRPAGPAPGAPALARGGGALLRAGRGPRPPDRAQAPGRRTPLPDPSAAPRG